MLLLMMAELTKFVHVTGVKLRYCRCGRGWVVQEVLMVLMLMLLAAARGRHLQRGKTVESIGRERCRRIVTRGIVGPVV